MLFISFLNIYFVSHKNNEPNQCFVLIQDSKNIYDFCSKRRVFGIVQNAPEEPDGICSVIN